MGLNLKSGGRDRNEPCPCQSGLKFKYCHGCALKQEVCNRVANETMVKLILQEKRKRGIPIEVVCPDCIQTPEIMKNCDFCNHTGVVTEVQVTKRKYEKLTEKEDGQEV